MNTLPEIWYEVPAFYFSNVASVVGPNDPVPVAPGSQAFDFELEVAAVIGREGSNIDPHSAMDHIAGYMIMCDWSARDIQERDMKLSMGPIKSKDTATTFGPYFVTADELAPYASGPSFHLKMSAFVNGEYVGGGFMDEMSWSLGDMVAYASRGTTLKPGDVLGCGTVPTGCLKELFARDNPAGKFRGWLKPGDVVRLEVEHLGATEQEVIETLPYPKLSNGF